MSFWKSRTPCYSLWIASCRTPLAVSYPSATTKTMYITAARFALWNPATSDQWLNGADLYIHSTHALPQITNSAIATSASRYAAISTSGSYSHAGTKQNFVFWEFCGVGCFQRLNVVAGHSSQNWRHFALMCAPSRRFLPAPLSLCTTNCVLLRDWVCW